MPQISPNMPRVFAALADPTRFAIVEQLLAHEELPIGDLAAPYAMSKPAISKHIKVLEDAGLIERRVEKQWRYCRLRRECFSSIEDWLGRYRDFWSTSLDRLDAILIEEDRDNQDD
jgi:DNA-binding transcriptional ArsR family regulator